ncbi:MAG TPA: translation elongation factor-like protein [Thermoplasmata archaeon]|jgi:putative protease|nr:translation elongation factor-like protein [Thermoplasmata archaeon]
MEKVKVGEVFHFFAKPSVAAIRVTDAAIRVGDTLLFQGPSTNFDQTIESLEIEKAKVQEATPGQSVGIHVRDRTRPGDLVYKIVG